MEEIICAGTVTDFTKFIKALDFKGALFLAEEMPQRIMSKPAERNKLLLFDLLDQVSDEERVRFTSGRIFTIAAELSWERTNENSYKVVYFGPPIELEGMKENSRKEFSTEDYELERKSYYLFGRHLDERQRERLKIAAEDPSSAGRLYAEARIPRLLRYPMTTQPAGKKDRVQLEILEYREKATKQITFYRFQHVKPAE